MGQIVLFAFLAAPAVIIWIAGTVVKALTADTDARITGRIRAVAWIITLLILGSFYTLLTNWAFETFSDFVFWTYVTAWTGALAFAAIDTLLRRVCVDCRHGLLSIVRLFLAFFITIQISELVELSFESMVIQQRVRAGWDTESRYLWGDGGNSMTYSEGLANYQGRTAQQWRDHFVTSIMASGLLIPYLLLLERLRLGRNPFPRDDGLI